MHGSLSGGALKKQIRVSGTQALALSTILTNLVRVVSTMCLTRLLSPDVFGITGMIMSTFYVVNMLTDIGIQAYVVRHSRSDETEFLNSVYTIHAIRGACLAGLGMLLAWPLSRLLDKPQIFLPLAAASLIFIIDGQASLHQYRGLRDGKVQRFTLIDLSTTITQTIFAIILAFILRNVWAIVLSMFVASAVRVWAGYAFFPDGRHSIRRDRDVASDLWRFSRVIAASSALTLILNQADKLALGRILSLGDFGKYVIAASLAGAPTAFAFNYASAVLYPAMAAAWRDELPIADVYYRYRRHFFHLYLLGGGVLIGSANLLIRLLYDPRYLQAATYLSILAVSTTLTIITRSIETIDVARGRPRTAVELNIARLIWLGAGSASAIYYSSALMFVFTIGLIELPAYIYGLSRLNRLHAIKWSRELIALLVVATGILAGGAATYMGKIYLPNL